jgi:hypothetical protein
MKYGHPHDRRKAAQLLRELRAMWPTLEGGWHRRDWYKSCVNTAHNTLSSLTRHRRTNNRT